MNIFNLDFTVKKKSYSWMAKFFQEKTLYIILFSSLLLSTYYFALFYGNHLGLAYNDSRSHLDIGRRVVEGLKPGLAQLGSVWLPLTHILMIPTIWNDFMWHSGLSGALQSMLSYVATMLLIYSFLKKIKVNMLGRLLGVLVFALNLNILYLQSTAMTELLLIATMTAGVYKFIDWQFSRKLLDLIKSAFFIMLSTLIRYDGWFLLFCAAILICILTYKRFGFKVTEGLLVLFCTLAGFGIVLWFAWNQVIFGDALYFAFGPYSAHTQQLQLQVAGNLPTKFNLLYSAKVYMYAMLFNGNAFFSVLGLLGAIIFYLDNKISRNIKFAVLLFFAPLGFNIIALYLGHSVLFIQGVSGNTWFNVRYGSMMVPTIAIFIGYLVHKLKDLRYVLVGLVCFVLVVSIINGDAVTIDDARVGSSQKNVSEVSGWLHTHAADQKGFILISAASHDAIIFSSGLPMSRFIHEGTGSYWESATTAPDRWARWIITRTHDLNDSTYKAVSKTPGFSKYNLVGHYPFADIYELKSQYLPQLITEPILPKQK